MFHSVGLERHPWYAPQISDDVDSFFDKMQQLHRRGYVCRKFTDPAIQSESSDPKLISLTFDDGYLDNWVHVFPILRQFGFEASIFMSTDFIDPSSALRSQCPPGVTHPSEHDSQTCCAGFLNVSEMKAMEESGLVEIQSHAKTHTWYFTGPRIVDYWRPGAATRPDGPVWMLWNLLPAMKPLYLTRSRELETRIPWGTPIYEHAKALESRRYYPHEPGLESALQEYVAEHGNEEFFRQEDWRERLDALVEGERASTESTEVAGEYESQEEFLLRVRKELNESREILGGELHKEVDALVWPGGGVIPEIIPIARELGYRYFTLPGRLDRTDDSGLTKGMLRRMTNVSRISWGHRNLGAMNGREFVWDIRRQSGSKRADLLYRASKSLRAARYLLRIQ
jgi:peptidoglycan/xylan/chitin deacetylase (PgdA/CDA1 family)